MENASLSFDKRKYPRVKIEIPVKYKVINQTAEALAVMEQKKTSLTAKSRDLSEKGLYLVSDSRLDKGDILKLEVFLPEEKHPVRAFSEVVWTANSALQGNRHGAGIYFMALRDEDAERMKKFVDAILSGEN